MEILISSFCYFNKQLCFAFTDDPKLHVVLALYSDSIPHDPQLHVVLALYSDSIPHDPKLHVVLALYSDSIPHVNQKGSLLRESMNMNGGSSLCDCDVWRHGC